MGATRRSSWSSESAAYGAWFSSPGGGAGSCAVVYDGGCATKALLRAEQTGAAHAIRTSKPLTLGFVARIGHLARFFFD